MKQKLKSILINFCYFVFGSKVESINEKIKNASVVSFDIFDTLIKRNIKSPLDVPLLVQEEYNNNSKTKIDNFKENRINAEKLSYKNSLEEEITLETIYDNMTCYTEKEKTILKNLEIQIEKDICMKNKKIYNIYKKCLDTNKKIIFTSDMYLPIDIVKDILSSCGYTKYDSLYLSSNKKLRKSTGNLFKQIIKETTVSSNKILHIGDNIKADFFIPKKYGMNSVLINKKDNALMFYSKNNKSLDYNILSSFINNSLNNYNLSDYEKYGYEVLGPILYSYVEYIHTKIKEDKIEKIYFLARDAKIIMDIYKELYNEQLPIYYLRVSRKSVVIASLGEVNSFDELYSKIKSLITNTSTIKDFLNVLNLNEENYTKDFKKYNINTTCLILDMSSIDKNNLFNIIHNDVIKLYKTQNAYLKEYLEENNVSGVIALIDIGWNGTIQYYLQNILPNNVTINGYYYGVSKNNKYNEYKNLIRNGYLFNANTLSTYQSVIQLSLGIFETMFLSNEPSTLSYKKENNLISIVYGKKDCSKDNALYISHIQNSAIKFVKDFYYSKTNKYVTRNAINYFENYNFFVTNPVLKKINLFKNIEFNDINNKKLIYHKSLFYYLFHPKTFYVDFRNSRCKIMFVKDIFKIKLPYYKILKKMYK